MTQRITFKCESKFINMLGDSPFNSSS